MAVVISSPTSTIPEHEPIPPLQNGDRLSRVEFERRYTAMSGVKKAELIEGIVYMPSPVNTRHHANPHFNMVGWLFLYSSQTPGITAGDNGTVRLDLDNEPQPDAYLMIDTECGGQAKIGDDGYVEGAPELVVEIAASSVSIDLHEKLRAYRRNGVREYVVWRVQQREIDWFILKDSEFVRVETDSDGLYRCGVLPGLVLNAEAMVTGDLQSVIRSQYQGLASEEYKRFVEHLDKFRTQGR